MLKTPHLNMLETSHETACDAIQNAKAYADVLDLAEGEESLARARRDSARTRRAWSVLCPR
jgi:hypothetical protein